METEKTAGDLVEALKNEAEKQSEALPAQPTSRVIDIQDDAQFNEVLSKATGPVVVDFVQQGCDACEADEPELEKLSHCENVTVLRVDLDKTPETEEKFDVGGTPTMMFAKTGEEFLKGKAKEVEPGPKLNRKLKCSR